MALRLSWESYSILIYEYESISKTREVKSSQAILLTCHQTQCRICSNLARRTQQRIKSSCKIMWAFRRDTFYRYRELSLKVVWDAQINRVAVPNLKKPYRWGNRNRLLLITLSPWHGQHRASNELREQGVLSPTVVFHLSGYFHNLETPKDDTEQIYQVSLRQKLYGVLDAVGATISTPAEPDYRAAVLGHVTGVPLVFCHGLFLLSRKNLFNPKIIYFLW